MGDSIGGFRNSVLGGFNREDVVKYIGRAAAENNKCREECARLRSEKEELLAKNAALEGRLSEIEANRQSARAAESEKDGRIAALEAELEKRAFALAEAEKARAEAEGKMAELENSLKSSEGARTRMSRMEYEACLRAERIEEDARREAGKAAERAEAAIAELKRRFEDIRSGTEVTAAHLRGELAKMGGGLGLIADIMDRTAEELGALSAAGAAKGQEEKHG